MNVFSCYAHAGPQAFMQTKEMKLPSHQRCHRYVREVLKGDTVYLTRMQYRDRWRTRLVHDTIRDTQIVEKVIEHPPERYVPKFYKWCTGLFWALLLVSVIVIVLKWKL